VGSSQQRDQALEQLLRRSVPPGDVTSACLDAETLAAWMDGGLSGPALDLAQSHLADCPRCQAMVGALVRIESAAPQIQPVRGARAWLNWLVPLTAAAATIAIWVAVPREAPGPPPTSPAAEQPAAPLSSRDAASPRREQQAKSALSDEKKQATAAAPQKSDAQERQRAEGVSALRKDEDRRAAAAPPPTLAEKPAELRRANERVGQAAAADLAAASAPVRWRVAESRLQRATTGGLWEDVSTGVTASLTAFAAPSPSVCWVVGRGGVVLLSTDGTAWRRVPFPEPTDLSAIEAADALKASVSTADGRTFDTTDGGVTWGVRPALQEF
jgi:hypothetical protein